MVISQVGEARKNQEKTNPKSYVGSKKATLIKALPREFLKQGWNTRAASGKLNPPAGYTGGCPSAAERPTEPVFWQLRRVRVCAGTC